MNEVLEAKRLVIEAGKELIRSSLIVRTWGNVSCRIDENSFVITPTGRNYNNLTEDEIVEVNLSDLSYHGNIKPSSEKRIHSEVYKLYKDANFVIHTHQINASIISASSLNSIAVKSDLDKLNGEILCAKYGLPGTKNLAKNVTEALISTTTNAIIMKNHGVICFGKDYEEAILVAKELEKACEEYLQNYYLNIKNKEENEISKLFYLQTISEKNNKLPIIAERFKDEVIIKNNMDNNSESKICKDILRNNNKINNVIIDSSPELLVIANEGSHIEPMLDDFAQIAGVKVQTVDNNMEQINNALRKSPLVFVKDVGAIASGISYLEADAVRFVAKKNCKAYIGARLFGNAKGVGRFDAALMRFVYLKKYSKKA